MPWREATQVSMRQEFVVLAQPEGRNVRELCRRFGIAPKTGYKWLARYAAAGVDGLPDRSRRPRHSPRRTAAALEAALLAVRREHPAWGARKIIAVLARRGVPALPAPSTVTGILRRHGCLDEGVVPAPGPHTRFERPVPNDLWQMDYKGHFALADGRCHPLTILDDHSRYCLALEACAREDTPVVRTRLTQVFRRYGLPWQLLTDNGPPWGGGPGCPYTPLSAWLIRVGVALIHGRPYHPQTQGKDERFHKTLQAEVLREPLRTLAQAQERFQRWRGVYNHERPHQALDYAVPAERYRPSARPFPETLPPIEYAPGDYVRKVQQEGELSFQGRCLSVSKAFAGYPVALRPTHEAGVFSVYFCHQCIARIDLRDLERGG